MTPHDGNLAGLLGFNKMLAPVHAAAAVYIKQEGLDIPPDSIEARSSKLARLTQCPKGFDFPADHLGSTFHHTGPFHAQGLRPEVPFPWERLTGEPLIYASMGTIQNGSERLFQTIVSAVEKPGHQLVLSTGRNLDPAQIATRLESTIVVQSAPQLLLLARACLCITHAGLNTVLEALAAGVPMVAIPITNDQPGVAARVAFTKTGAVVPLQQLSVDVLREAVETVSADAAYRERAKALQAEIRETDGLKKAATLIEEVFATKAA